MQNRTFFLNIKIRTFSATKLLLFIFINVSDGGKVWIMLHYWKNLKKPHLSGVLGRSITEKGKECTRNLHNSDGGGDCGEPGLFLFLIKFFNTIINTLRSMGGFCGRILNGSGFSYLKTVFLIRTTRLKRFTVTRRSGRCSTCNWTQIFFRKRKIHRVFLV